MHLRLTREQIEVVRGALDAAARLGPFVDAGNDDACEVTVRISNHARKPNSHLPPAWSFEPSDKVTSYSAGIHAVQAAIADEIVNVRDQE